MRRKQYSISEEVLKTPNETMKIGYICQMLVNSHLFLLSLGFSCSYMKLARTRKSKISAVFIFLLTFSVYLFRKL